MITNDVHAGQRVRVTLLKDVWGWEGVLDDGTMTPEARRVRTPAGTVYEGYASDIVDRFFDLNMDDGEAMGFFMDDPAILIVALS